VVALSAGEVGAVLVSVVAVVPTLTARSGVSHHIKPDVSLVAHGSSPVAFGVVSDP
jgi:hypothetical protein